MESNPGKVQVDSYCTEVGIWASFHHLVFPCRNGHKKQLVWIHSGFLKTDFLEMNFKSWFLKNWMEVFGD
jgi:hypothetical protein